jgi:acyl transferase domain-containing protein
MEPIAIIGMGCRFPGADSPEAFWELLRDGVDAITEVPIDRWNISELYNQEPRTPGKMNTRWGGFIEHVDQFDAAFFGISPCEAERMDPQQRLLLEVTWETLENAGIAAHELAGSATGVFIGISNSDYSRLLYRDYAVLDAYSGTGTAMCIAAKRISYLLNLRGPSLAIDTACSSSLAAVHLACQSLLAEESSLAVVGGVNLILTPEYSILLSQGQVLSATGRCRTFDANADGYTRGEGCGVLLLKRLSEALRDGDNIRALILGSAVNQDGRSNGLTAPNGPAQQAVIRKALHNAGVTPSNIGYVEVHGTGTKLGDAIEFDALKSVFRMLQPQQSCVLGALKTNLGHLEAAAGIAGLIKAVLVLQHKEIPPNLHLKRLNPYIELRGTPFIIPTEMQDWPREHHPYRNGVSSFGMGGTNAHVVLEEAPPQQPLSASTQSERPLHLLCLSAKSETALQASADRFRQYLAAHPSSSLADVCFSANTGRSHFNYRLSAVTSSVSQLDAQLTAFAAAQPTPQIRTAHCSSHTAAQVVFLFTGQGRLHPNVARELYLTYPVFRQTIDQCDQLLQPLLKRSLLKLLYPPSEASDFSGLLDQPTYGQPALFAIEYALAQLWCSWGIHPAALLGHSLGEYAAACLAGIFTLSDALKLVAARGQVMQSSPAGRMASVFASETQVNQLLTQLQTGVVIAALNGQSHTVVSGAREEVERVLQQCTQLGLKTRLLPVSHTFHSPAIDELLSEFAQVARQVHYQVASLPFVSGASGRPLGADEVANEHYWCRQMHEAVQFTTGIEHLWEKGYRVYVEVGCHPMLLKMGKRCVRLEGGTWVGSLHEECSEWEILLDSLSQLYLSGVEVDWDSWDQGYGRKRLDLPSYPFERVRYWLPTVQTQSTRLEASKVHPLLGQGLGPIHQIFQSRLDIRSLPYLAEHRVHRQLVLPATAYLELGLAAGLASAAQMEDPCKLREVTFRQSLFLEECEEKIVEMVVTAETPSQASFEVRSSSLEMEKGASLLYASGKIGNGSAVPTTPTMDIVLEIARNRCLEEVARSEHYRRLQESGLEYGPSFKGVECLWLGKDEALGKIRMPTPLENEFASYQIHPALLDACLQIITSATHTYHASIEPTAAYLPVSLDRLHIFQRPNLSLWSYATLVSSGGSNPNVFTSNLCLFDSAGNIAVEILGLRSQCLEPAGESVHEESL